MLGMHFVSVGPFVEYKFNLQLGRELTPLSFRYFLGEVVVVLEEESGKEDLRSGGLIGSLVP